MDLTKDLTANLELDRPMASPYSRFDQGKLDSISRHYKTF